MVFGKCRIQEREMDETPFFRSSHHSWPAAAVYEGEGKNSFSALAASPNALPMRAAREKGAEEEDAINFE